MGRTALALLLLSALSGCAPAPEGKPTSDATPDVPFAPDECKPSLDAPREVRVGEGQTVYRDIPDGTVLIWEKGPQGGHHVWIAVRQKGFRMRGTILTIELEDVQDPAKPILVNRSKLVYDFDRDEGGWCARPGLRMQLDNAGGVKLSDLSNHRIKVTASLKDPDGATASGTRYIVVDGLLH